MFYNILVVDDEPVICKSLKMALSKDNFNVQTCKNGKDALELVKSANPDLVLLDINLPDINGLQVLDEIKKHNNDIIVIMITAYGDINTVLKAVKSGAYHYIQKPIDINELDIIINNAITKIKLKKEVSSIRKEHLERYDFDRIIGSSLVMERTLEKAKQFSKGRNTTILIEGETGTGKELFTRAIHYLSERRNNPLIAINCGSIPSELVESELFGYEKGAFTGALQRRNPGKFELANGGTLLLDEISELSKHLQVKLLRVLQEKEFYRLGGSESVKVDVRIISTTNKCLEILVENGEFREDLYYRLNVAKLTLPPLRERGKDIIHLAKVFLHEFNKEFNKNFIDISQEAQEYLINLPWKGNIRELRNIIERLVLTEKGTLLNLEHIKAIIFPSALKYNESIQSDNEVDDSESLNLDDNIAKMISKALKVSKGNKSAAAQLLGLSRSNFRYKLNKYKLG